MRAGSASGRWRGGWRGEVLLAIPPTATMLVALYLLETLSHQRILFASLASSAFLLYRDPWHPMNGVRVMVCAHLVAVVIGVVAALLLGAGYAAGAAAMVITIGILILGDLVHPPAISTALGFAFFAQQGHATGLFVMALGMVAALVVLQRGVLWAARWLRQP